MTAKQLAAWKSTSTGMLATQSDMVTGTEKVSAAVVKQAEAMVLAATANGNLSDEEAVALAQRLKTAESAEDYKSIMDEVTAANEAAAETARANAASVKEVARSFDEADVAASNYNEALDTLSGRHVSAEESMLQFQASMDELKASTEEQSDAMLDQGNLTTEGKLQFLDYLKAIQSTTAENIRNGDSQETAAGKARMMYEGLINTFGQLGANTDALRTYADQMNMTPDELETLIKAVGIETETDAIREMLSGLQDIDPKYVTRIETLLDRGKLTQAYRVMDKLGIPITKQIVAKAMGIKEAGKALTDLSKKKLVAIIQSQTPNVKENESKLLSLTKKQLIARIRSETPDVDKDDDKLNQTAKRDRKAVIHSETPDAKKNDNDLNNVADKKRTAKIASETPNASSNSNTLDNVARSRTANINVSVNGVSQAENALNNLSRDRTTTNTVRQVVVQAPGKQEGGPVWANRLYTVGEGGPELFVPSQSGYVFPANHPLTRLASQLGTLKLVEPSPTRPVGVGPAGTATVSMGRGGARNLSIGNMVINQDLDLDVALTRIGMAMSESTL
jgi:hypothetical protein